MGIIEPIPGEPAAIATLPDERALVIADYHAGYEAELRYDRGIDVPSRAPDRRERLLSLLEQTGVSHLVVLGDLMHSIGDPGGAERGELEVLFESFPTWLSVTVVKGNHDGAIESWLGGPSDGQLTATELVPQEQITIVPGHGVSLGDGTLGVCHGHTWPSRDVLESRVVCHGHEHPFVRLEDEVGGTRVEPAWLRGRLDPTPFRERSTSDYDGLSWLPSDGDSDDSPVVSGSDTRSDDGPVSGSDAGSDDVLVGGSDGESDDVIVGGSDGGLDSQEVDKAVDDRDDGPATTDHRTKSDPSVSVDNEDQHRSDDHRPPELIVFPAFNDLVGGTWINVPGQTFLSPYLPSGLADGEVYLLDGTRLGPYESI